MSANTLTRLICDNLNLRAYTVECRDLTKQIIGMHHLSPTPALALGRLISGTILLSASLKPDSNQSISVKIAGSGQLGTIMVQTDAQGNIRGYAANPVYEGDTRFEKIDIPHAMGAALLTVTRDLDMKTPYTAVSPILKGEIATDIAYYLTTSEQIPSAILLGLEFDENAQVKAAGGILIQTFPDTSPESIGIVEKNIANMSETLGSQLRKGEDVLTVLMSLLDNNPVKIVSETPLKFACHCNRDLLSGVIGSLKHDDLQELIDSDQGAELVCQFCNKKYFFTVAELKALQRQKG